MIKVLSKRFSLSQPLPRTARVYVGRPTPLGNPFVVGPDGNLEQVLDKYAKWLQAKLTTKNQTSAMFNRLLALSKTSNLELVCWCAPDVGLTTADITYCHGQIVASFLEQRLVKRPATEYSQV